MVGVLHLDFGGRLGHASLKATAVPSLRMAEFRHSLDTAHQDDSEKHNMIAKTAIDIGKNRYSTARG
jgi:hypothetical protein